MPGFKTTCWKYITLIGNGLRQNLFLLKTGKQYSLIYDAWSLMKVDERKKSVPPSLEKFIETTVLNVTRIYVKSYG